VLREPEHNREAQLADAGGCVDPGCLYSIPPAKSRTLRCASNCGSFWPGLSASRLLSASRQ
jgi:hypothetical protein